LSEKTVNGQTREGPTKDGVGHPVLRSSHVERVGHACHIGVGDVASVQEGDDVEKCQHGDQAVVHFA